MSGTAKVLGKDHRPHTCKEGGARCCRAYRNDKGKALRSKKRKDARAWRKDHNA